MKLDDTDILIIEYLAEGLTCKEIAQKVFLSDRTVENRIQKMRKKTDCKTYGQLIAWFQKQSKLDYDKK